jgi:hypothetical protein
MRELSGLSYLLPEPELPAVEPLPEPLLEPDPVPPMPLPVVPMPDPVVPIPLPVVPDPLDVPLLLLDPLPVLLPLPVVPLGTVLGVPGLFGEVVGAVGSAVVPVPFCPLPWPVAPVPFCPVP